MQSLDTIDKRMNPQTEILNNPSFPRIRWNIPEIAKYSECGLSSVSVSTLQRCLQPVLEGLRQIDATELLGLEYVTVGPQIKEGYVFRCM